MLRSNGGTRPSIRYVSVLRALAQVSPFICSIEKPNKHGTLFSLFR